VIPAIYRVPMIPFTRIYGNLIVGLVLILAVHWVIKRTTIGFEWRVLFAGKPTAVHVGMKVSRISLWAFLASGGFAGLAGVSDVLSVQGLFKGGWNPSYMFTCIPLVFLARLNGWAIIPLAYFFSFLAIAGEFVARDLGVPYYFVHVLEGLILLFFAASEYIEKRSEV
jgi:simple sugar transport system permease protein